MNIITTINIEDVKKQIREQKTKPIIVQAQNEQFNRSILEYGKFDILLDVETTTQKKDKPKQMDAGFNHVLAAIATKNHVALGINLSHLRELNKKEKAKALARIKQNINVCRKAKTRIALINFNDKINAQTILLSLGASTQQAHEAIV